jgi:hypothetical protein
MCVSPETKKPRRVPAGLWVFLRESLQRAQLSKALVKGFFVAPL